MDVFFSPSRDKSSDDEELLLIRKTLDTLVETTELAQFEQTLSIDLVKEWLNEHIDINQSQTRFMGQGVTWRHSAVPSYNSRTVLYEPAALLRAPVHAGQSQDAPLDPGAGLNRPASWFWVRTKVGE